MDATSASSPGLGLAALLAHLDAMPPVAALKPTIDAAGDGWLRLRAPLEANVNDKGCAFGGSLVSLMTVAAWGAVSLALEQAGIDADVFVADSRVRYARPVFEDIVVQATFAYAAERTGLDAALRSDGRASLKLEARTLLADGTVAATFSGRYVVIVRTSPAG